MCSPPRVVDEVECRGPPPQMSTVAEPEKYPLIPQACMKAETLPDTPPTTSMPRGACPSTNLEGVTPPRQMPSDESRAEVKKASDVVDDRLDTMTAQMEIMMKSMQMMVEKVNELERNSTENRLPSTGGPPVSTAGTVSSSTSYVCIPQNPQNPNGGPDADGVEEL